MVETIARTAHAAAPQGRRGARHAERREAANYTKDAFCLSQFGGARGDTRH